MGERRNYTIESVLMSSIVEDSGSSPMSLSNSITMGVLAEVEVAEASAVTGSSLARSCSEITLGDLVFFGILPLMGPPRRLPCAVVMADAREEALTSDADSCKYQNISKILESSIMKNTLDAVARGL